MKLPITAANGHRSRPDFYKHLFFHFIFLPLYYAAAASAAKDKPSVCLGIWDQAGLIGHVEAGRAGSKRFGLQK